MPASWCGDTVPRMIDDLDILRAASILIKRHGADAAIEAARQADELLEAGGMDGCAIWKRILSAVAELTRTAPAEGERVNRNHPKRKAQAEKVGRPFGSRPAEVPTGGC